jgi:WD40 repeat protein
VQARLAEDGEPLPLARAVRELPIAVKGHTDQVLSVAFSPDGQRLASASDYGTVKIWDASDGSEAAPPKK